VEGDGGANLALTDPSKNPLALRDTFWGVAQLTVGRRLHAR